MATTGRRKTKASTRQTKATSTERRTMTLSELRRAQGKSQVELGAELSMEQSELSRIERRPNVRLATLAKYVEGLGGQLELVAVFGSGRVKISL